MKLTPTEPDIRTIVERIDRHDIDLQPDFQRQEVWSNAKKKKLVDTVLRGWSIPPIHLVETSGNKLEVLDGQQRLAALRDFVHNRFSIDGRVTPADPRIVGLHGKFYKQLDDATRRWVDQYPIRCFRITDYLPEEPSELFYRLNQPTMLTAGEQRNALYGPARVQMKELVQFFEISGNTQDAIGFSNTRLSYDDIFARLLFFIEQRNFGAKGTESIISERFRTKTEFAPTVIDTARNAIERFSEARGLAQPFRFNKASMLSWLLFFSRFDNSGPVANTLQAFISASQAPQDLFFIKSAIGVFEDRSSLRVTDVSSVVYRDFCLFYVYHFMKIGPLPSAIPIQYFEEVRGTLDGQPDVSFETALNELLPIDQWSTTL